MRLIRIGARGKERPGVLLGDEDGIGRSFVDVGDEVLDYDEAFFAGGGLAALSSLVERRVSAGAAEALDGQRLGAPIARPHQILGIGLNYAEHIAETATQAAAEPVVFNKAPNSLSGPYDPVVLPPGASAVDYEVELGVVVGRRCQYLTDLQAASNSIAGFVVVNDVSERDYQLERGGQWVKGKSFQSFNPCGPFLATLDEVPRWQELDLWLDVNGERRQDGSTSDMIFDVLTIIHYLSQVLVLEPGDLIDTGTPPGVGLGMDPPTYLKAGDELRLGITGLGEQRYPVVPFQP